ncbi:hypothetical protein D3C72_1406100 [compost metagenome]
MLERLVARGGEHVQAGRRHEDARAGQARAIQHLVQQMRGRAAHFLRPLDHGTQGNAREHARQRVVVDADQSHLLRHRDARMHARLQQLARACIADGDDADGFFQAVEPGDLLLHRLVPRRRAGGDAPVHVGAHVVALHQGAKCRFALLRPAVDVGLGQAETGETRQARFHQVFIGQLDDLEIIGRHIRDAGRVILGARIRATHGHHGQAAVRQRFADGGIVKIGDDAVALPAFDAGQAAAEILFQEQVPRHARRVQIGGDARDDVAVVDFIPVKQQRDPVRGRHLHGVSSRARSFHGYLRPARVLTSTHTARVRILPFTIICQ